MPLKMKDTPLSERPYEKLNLYGAQQLSNAELLAIIIKTGTKNETAVDLARRVFNLGQKQQEDLTFLTGITIEQLQNIKGIGKVKAIQIKAVCELANRIGKPIHSNKWVIKTAQDVYQMMQDMRFLTKEIVKVVILNTKNVVQKIVKISQGRNKFCGN